MAEVKIQSTPTSAYDPYPVDFMVLARLFVAGLLAGALGWLLYLGIIHFFILPIFCHSSETFGICNNGGTLAWIAAHVIVMAATVAGLVALAVYRPLLIVLGALISLWGANAWLGALSWPLGMLWEALLFGFAVAVFGWVARTTKFIPALIVTIVLVLLARLVLLAA